MKNREEFLAERIDACHSLTGKAISRGDLSSAVRHADSLLKALKELEGIIIHEVLVTNK